MFGGVDPRFIWFVLGLALLFGELLTPGIVLLFFGLGAWTVALVVLVLPLGSGLQLALFILASTLYLVLFRVRLIALLQKKTLLHQDDPEPDIETAIGQEVDVVESIVPPHPGRVLWNGTLWQAIAETGVSAGTRVKIVKQDVLMLTVEPLNNIL